MLLVLLAIYTHQIRSVEFLKLLMVVKLGAILYLLMKTRELLMLVFHQQIQTYYLQLHGKEIEKLGILLEMEKVQPYIKV